MKDTNGKDLKAGQRVTDRLAPERDGEILEIYTREYGIFKGVEFARIQWDNGGFGSGYPGGELILA